MSSFASILAALDLDAAAPRYDGTILEQLRNEAGESGDSTLVALCNAALAGDASARAKCAEIIATNMTDSLED